MQILVIAGLVVLLAIGFGYVIGNLVLMRWNPNLFLFPAITSCRLCDRRVYVWQRRERREWTVPILEDGVPVSRGVLSAIVHRRCEGRPKTEFTVTREVVLASDYSNPAG